MQRLSHKSAIVTGGTSGLGLGIARALAQQGADVMLQGRGCVHEIAGTCAELRKHFGVRVAHAGVALGCAEQMCALAQCTRARFGKIDIVVNGAGIAQPEASIGDAALAIEVLSQAFHLICAVVPEMKLRRYGRIINVAAASPCRPAHLAARHGMIGLARTVAQDGAAFGITAHTICQDGAFAPTAEQLIALAVFFACEESRSHTTHH